MTGEGNNGGKKGKSHQGGCGWGGRSGGGKMETTVLQQQLKMQKKIKKEI